VEKERLVWARERMDLVEKSSIANKKAGKALCERERVRDKVEKEGRKALKEQTQEADLRMEQAEQEKEVMREYLQMAAERYSKLHQQHLKLKRVANQEDVEHRMVVSALQTSLDIIRRERDDVLKTLKEERRNQKCGIDLRRNEIATLRTLAKRHQIDLNEENRTLQNEVLALRDQADLHSALMDRQVEKTPVEETNMKLFELETAVSQAEHDRKAIETAHTVLTTERDQLLADQTEARSNLETTTVELSQTKQRLIELGQSHSELTKRASTSETATVQMKEELENLKREIKVERARWEERKDVVKRLGGDLGRMGQGYQALQEECDR
jgi:hypothetical protein